MPLDGTEMGQINIFRGRLPDWCMLGINGIDYRSGSIEVTRRLAEKNDWTGQVRCLDDWNSASNNDIPLPKTDSKMQSYRSDCAIFHDCSNLLGIENPLLAARFKQWGQSSTDRTSSPHNRSVEDSNRQKKRVPPPAPWGIFNRYLFNSPVATSPHPRIFHFPLRHVCVKD